MKNLNDYLKKPEAETGNLAILFGSIIFIGCLGCFICGILSWIKSRKSAHPDVGNNHQIPPPMPPQPPPLPPHLPPQQPSISPPMPPPLPSRAQAPLVDLNSVDPATENQNAECIICYENQPSTKLNCGHTGMCLSCAYQIEYSFGKCPICTQPIRRIKEEIYTQRSYLTPSNSGNSTSISNSSKYSYASTLSEMESGSES